MTIIACTCNQPQRLPAALSPVRPALIASAPISRWGLGYIQGDNVLLVRTPRASTSPVDLAGPIAELTTDCAIAQAVRDERATPLGGTDNTPPFRFRRWLYAQTDRPALDELVASGALHAHVPEFLRRNIRGRSPAELVFHVFLAQLSRLAQLDDPNLAPDLARKALAQTLKLVGVEPSALGTIALTNGRCLIVARTSDEPVRLRRLTVTPDERFDDRGVNAFRGYILIAGPEPVGDGFEEIAANHAVVVSRDLQVTQSAL